MPISNQLLGKLERQYHQAFKIDLDRPSQLIEKIQAIIQIRPKAYYQRQDNVATATEWPELDAWHQYAEHYQIHLKHLQHYKMLCGKHKNHKYGDLFITKYDRQPNVHQIQQHIDLLLNTYYLKSIQKYQADVYHDDDYQQILIMIRQGGTVNANC